MQGLPRTNDALRHWFPGHQDRPDSVDLQAFSSASLGTTPSNGLTAASSLRIATGGFFTADAAVNLTLLIDVDNFKGVNDTTEYAFGDEVLVEEFIDGKELTVAVMHGSMHFFAWLRHVVNICQAARAVVVATGKRSSSKTVVMAPSVTDVPEAA